MLLVAAFVFVYYTTWAILLVSPVLLTTSSLYGDIDVLNVAFLRRVESHTRLLPRSRMGSPPTSIHPRGRTFGNRFLHRVHHHEGESQKGSKSQASGSMTQRACMDYTRLKLCNTPLLTQCT